MTEEYAHYHFFDHCKDEPAAILALVEKMFGEIAKLPNGNIMLVRARPTIERFNDFSKGPMATVNFRFSLKITPDWFSARRHGPGRGENRGLIIRSTGNRRNIIIIT